MRRLIVEEKQLAELDKELTESARYITITPDGYLLSGWTKAEAALLLSDLGEQMTEEALTELIEGRE